MPKIETIKEAVERVFRNEISRHHSWGDKEKKVFRAELEEVAKKAVDKNGKIRVECR